MRIAGIKQALGFAYGDLVEHHTFQVAAALSYWFVLSVFPALIFLSAFVGWLHQENLFGGILRLMSQLFPSDTMRAVYSVLHDVLSPHNGGWLSLG